MLITASLGAVVFASGLAGAAPVTSTLPPMTIGVAAGSAISPALVKKVLAETDAVWRAAGLTFVWRRDSESGGGPTIDAGPYLAPTLRVVMGAGRAADAGRRRDSATALGWIVFDADGPASEIYLSYDNAAAYMEGARAVVGAVDRMPVAEREMLLARAMGRALAHEIGHYLLASKIHTQRGLMRALHSAAEFFGYERSAFGIDATQRQAVAERLRQDRWVAMRDPL